MTDSTPQAAVERLIELVRREAIPVNDTMASLAPLFDMARDARYVLIGEATHGTEEFYRMRAEITKVLLRDHGFCAVAVEGDWPDCGRVNRYVRGDPAIAGAADSLSAFSRFPAWMWRNHAVADFVSWMRTYNASMADPSRRAGFYGLDLYSMYASIEEVIRFLDSVDPVAGERARAHYACFDHTHRLARDPHTYAYSTYFGVAKSCERQAIQQLADLRLRAPAYLDGKEPADPDDLFFAERNARIVLSAEAYYRTMFNDHAVSWNLRDEHMAETLFALSNHLSRQRKAPAKIVVWAHNSHVGDATATEAGARGELTLGQLVREAHGPAAVSISFTTYDGSVTAASEWDGQEETKQVRPAMRGSYEDIFHATEIGSFLLRFADNPRLSHLEVSRLHRAIGVLYLPETERQSHYLFASLPKAFDAVIHIDRTSALRPLAYPRVGIDGEILHTYPEGL